MTPDKAAKLLGVAVGASAEDVRAAFAVKVKASHPDTALLEGLTSSMAALKRARDVLMEPHMPTGALKPCPVCRGTGVQAIGLRRFPCVRGCAPP